MNETSELKIIIEQLETCCDFIDENTITKYRIVIILLDNITEILSLRCYKSALDSDDFSKWIIPPEFDSQKKVKISKLFEEKIKLLETKNNISKLITENLNICHKYRNAIYHRDVHNESTIEIIAKIFFISVCELFKEISAGHKGLTIGGLEKSFNWLIKYGYEDSYIDFNKVTNLVASKLLKRINLNLNDAIKISQTDIFNRINEIKELVANQLPWKTPDSINHIIKYFEFEERFPQVEDDLSSEYRKYIYKIGNDEKTYISSEKLDELKNEFITNYHQRINNYKQEIKYSIIERASDIALNFSNNNHFSELLSDYYGIDISLSKLEYFIDLALIEFDKMVQREIDIRRGK